MSEKKNEISSLADELLEFYDDTANFIENEIQQMTTVIVFGNEPLITDEMVRQLEEEKKEKDSKEQEVKSETTSQEVENNKEVENVKEVENTQEELKLVESINNIPEKIKRLMMESNKNNEVEHKQNEEAISKNNKFIDILYLLIPVISAAYISLTVFTNIIKHKEIASSIILLITLSGFSVLFMKKSEIYTNKLTRYAYLIVILTCSVLTGLTYIL